MSRMAEFDLMLQELANHMTEKGYYTLREIYEELGGKCNNDNVYDPDSWGWDDHGFRRLFDENGNFIPYEES